MLDNATILANCYLKGTRDFQQRLPYPTQGNIAAFTEELLNPYNGALYNEFIDLINVIAMTYVIDRKFDNPLAPFKRPSIMKGGKTIRDIGVKWFKAHTFKADDETLFKLEAPEFQSWYYTVNRQDQYRFSWTREEISFALEDEYGLNNLLAATMSALVSSDAYDEMTAMLACFSEANAHWKTPFFNVKINGDVSTEVGAKEILQAVKGLVYQLAVQPSTTYNAVDIPVFAKPEELVLLVYPSVRASLDVNAFAQAFNLDYATTAARIITIPEGSLGIPNTYAVLTTVDFFVVADKYYGIDSAPFNPNTLSNKYYLNHWEIISANPLVPVIRFSSDDDTNVPVVTMTASGIKLEAENETVKAGGTVAINATLEGTVKPETEGVKVAPDSVIYTVEYDGDKKRIYVDRLGVLHVSKAAESGLEIKVTGVSTYINPDGKTSEFSDTVTVTVE